MTRKILHGVFAIFTTAIKPPPLPNTISAALKPGKTLQPRGYMNRIFIYAVRFINSDCALSSDDTHTGLNYRLLISVVYATAILWNAIETDEQPTFILGYK
ncbi:hypothetical protein CBL_12432 [Carabus blaptoides fortunei]